MKRLFTVAALLVTSLASFHGAESLVVENPEGLVTSAEIQAFKNYLRGVPVPRLAA